ncbi:MAG: histidine kinase dimerization/phospho-acceptor domain-containing protein [Gammaproteobacteria bacterium]|nr:histidine kinase dimerization/phospho-acceptor domain-containing protein [Gammaproteobacteria bacterium]
MSEARVHTRSRLLDQAGLSPELEEEARRADDQAWIDVIQRMDSIYTDLVHYQVELEEKNSELEDAQRFIQSVISSMTEVLIVCDVSGRIQQVNQALLDHIGVTAEALIGESLTMLFSKKDLSKVADFPQHIRAGSLIECEVDLVDSKRQLVPMALNCSARFDHDNLPSGLVITGRPLGELRRAYSDLHRAHEDLKAAQQHLVQSEKLASLGRLVAGVAHELNNPISFLFANMHALSGYRDKLATYLDAIHADVEHDERERLRAELRIDHLLQDIAPLLEGSMEGAERVSEIVQNLRRFATPQQGEQVDFDLVSVVDRAINWVLKAASVKPEVVTHFPESLVLCNSEGHVHQILVNLLQNALDAMALIDRPRLEITIEAGAEFARVRVRDFGHGINDADLLRLFDPFFTTKAVGTGTGLGLYISYGLATEQCRGNLEARSFGSDGAEFALSLPLGGEQ